MIPKIIHQTYKSYDTIPKEWKNTPLSWQKLNPEYEYKFWSDNDIDNFVKNEFPQYYEKFKSLEYNIQRVDMVRYMWMYKYGGIYVDMDIECTRPISTLIDFYEKTYNPEIILITTPNTIQNDINITNSFMISAPNSQFWIKVLDYINNFTPTWQMGKHLKVMFSTGPTMLSKLYNENKNDFSIYLIPHQLINNCSLCDKKPYTTLSSFVKTLQGGSWNELDAKFFNYMFCIPKQFWFFIIIITILIFIILFMFYKNRLRDCEKSLSTCEGK